MKKVITLLLAACMVLTLFAGCGGTPSSNPSTSTPPASEGNQQPDDASISDKSGDVDAVASDTYLRDKVTIAISGDGSTFDPFTMARWGNITFPFFQGLALTDSSGKLRLEMLKSIEKVDDVTYNCEIWDFIYDSEGNHITADDVLWSINYFSEMGNAGAVNKLDYLEKTGDYTFIWHCNAPFDVGEYEKNFSNTKVLSQKAYESRGSDGMSAEPVGTGPYMLESYVPGSTVVITANEDFWMKNITDEAWMAENFYANDYQNVKTIEYQIIQDAGSRAIALEMGMVDAADSLNATDVDYFIANPDLGVIPVELPQDPPVAYYYNCNPASVCSDINLRKAICYALDNVAIAAGISYPGQPAYGMSPRMYDAPESWTTGEGRDYYDYDLDKAREYLAQSSYAGESLVIMYQEMNAFPDVVVMMQAALKEIGVNVTLLPADFAVLNEYSTDYTKWDITYAIMGGGNYLSAVLKKFWTEDSAASNNGNQVTGIVDTHLDELFVALQEEANEETISAWDEYFTNEMCYGYAICLYSTQTGCRSDINCVLTGSQHNLTPNAFTYND